MGLANGHGRLDLCSPCGIVEFSPVDGQGAFRLRVEGTEKRAKPVRVEPDEWYRGRGSSSRLKREA